MTNSTLLQAMTAPQPAFGYYDDARYSAQPAYPAMYAPRSATVAPGHQSDPRRLPPLSTTPAPGRDERWASSYPAPTFNGPPNSHIRSPTASYPASYTTAYPAANPYGYDDVNDPMRVGPQSTSNGKRSPRDIAIWSGLIARIPSDTPSRLPHRQRRARREEEAEARGCCSVAGAQ